MRRNIFKANALTLTLLACSTMALAEPHHFEVTVTNLTRGQVFTPIMVASHKEGVSLFTLGQPASVALESLAESGDTNPLKTLLVSSHDVDEAVDSGAVLPPGQSVTVMVQTSGAFDHISVAAMLVPTNDGFFAINGIEGPKGKDTLTLYSPAYDAGTEANNELCSSIPGPPTICQGEGYNASRAGAEGYVHIHAGIHGIGNLMPAMSDWRNPVAKIVIRRVN
ncbi:MAG: spondin domain-containing protein [Acidobacteriota bacterium]